MSVLRIMNRGVDREMYNAVGITLDLDHDHPLGLIMHGASEVDGMMLVAQVWDSEEYALRFDEDRLEPALRAAGAPLHAEVTIFELQHLVTP
jgi:hypothetical protein